MMKKDMSLNSQALRGLADSIDIMNPADFLSQDDTTSNIKIKRANWDLCWRSQSPVKSVSFGSESFELAIQSCGDTFPLLRFMGQLDGMLNDLDSYGDILRIAHTRDCGTVVTIQIQPTKLGNLMLKFATIPEVEKVEKEPVATSVFFRSTGKFTRLPTSSAKPSTRICITLREANFAMQEQVLMPVLA